MNLSISKEQIEEILKAKDFNSYCEDNTPESCPFDCNSMALVECHAEFDKIRAENKKESCEGCENEGKIFLAGGCINCSVIIKPVNNFKPKKKLVKKEIEVFLNGDFHDRHMYGAICKHDIYTRGASPKNGSQPIKAKLVYEVEE